MNENEQEQAEVRISRTTCSLEPDYISVEIITPTRFVRVKLSLADFALALTAQSGITGTILTDRVKKTKKEQ